MINACDTSQNGHSQVNKDVIRKLGMADIH